MLWCNRASILQILRRHKILKFLYSPSMCTWEPNILKFLQITTKAFFKSCKDVSKQHYANENFHWFYNTCFARKSYSTPPSLHYMAQTFNYYTFRWSETKGIRHSKWYRWLLFDTSNNQEFQISHPTVFMYRSIRRKKCSIIFLVTCWNVLMLPMRIDCSKNFFVHQSPEESEESDLSPTISAMTFGSCFNNRSCSDGFLRSSILSKYWNNVHKRTG